MPSAASIARRAARSWAAGSTAYGGSPSRCSSQPRSRGPRERRRSSSMKASDQRCWWQSATGPTASWVPPATLSGEVKRFILTTKALHLTMRKATRPAMSVARPMLGPCRNAPRCRTSRTPSASRRPPCPTRSGASVAPTTRSPGCRRPRRPSATRSTRSPPRSRAAAPARSPCCAARPATSGSSPSPPTWPARCSRRAATPWSPTPTATRSARRRCSPSSATSAPTGCWSPRSTPSPRQWEDLASQLARRRDRRPARRGALGRRGRVRQRRRLRAWCSTTSPSSATAGSQRCSPSGPAPRTGRPSDWSPGRRSGAA